MSSAFFNRLAQVTVPAFGARMFPDRMRLVSAARSQDSIGGVVDGSTTNDYSDVPCAYAPKSEGRQTPAGEKIESQKEFVITFPSHTAAGSRINFDPAKHWIVIEARGSEPSKTFSVTAFEDSSGVIFRVECTKEN